MGFFDLSKVNEYEMVLSCQRKISLFFNFRTKINALSHFLCRYKCFKPYKFSSVKSLRH